MEQVNPETLLVPRGIPDLAPLRLDLSGILHTESRIQETAFLTPVKAQELMALFNKSFCDISNMISQVEFEYKMAKKKLSEIRAVILIDRLPTILKEKGLSSNKSPTGSEDIRNAILEMDPNYSHVQEIIIQLECILSLLEGKRSSIDKAYTSAKAVYKEQSGRNYSPDYSVPHSSNTPSFFTKE